MADLALASPQETTAPQQPLSLFQRLSEDAKTALQGGLRSALKDNQVPRREEVRVAWKLRDYCRGKQHAVYDSRNYLYVTLAASGEGMPMHMGTYDITSPQKRTFVAILSEQAPGVNFVPNDLQAANDVTAAKSAEKMRGRVDRLVDMKQKQSKASGYFCTDGRVIAWTHINQYGKLAVDLFGVLESKVPTYAQSREDWGYCVLSREVDVWRAKWEWPDFADQISTSDAGSGESSYERYARLGVISKSRGGSVETLKGLVTEHFCWLAPWRYAKMQDGVRQEIEQAFPSGVIIHAFGETVVDARSVDEEMYAGELAVEFPVDGEGQTKPALLNGVPDIQDAYNDIKNLMRELAEYGSPATWVNTSKGVDLDAVSEQRSEPAAVHGIEAGNSPMSEVIFQETPAVISSQVVAMLPDLKQDAEYNTGAYAQLQGDEVTGQDTVGVNKLLTNQAKGQLGPAWSAIQRLWSKIYPTAIRLAAMQEQSPVAVSGPNGQDTVDPQLILDGNFYCHPDQDSSFPETTADKRAALQAVFSQLAQDPDGAKIVFHPDNLTLIKQYSGLKDLVLTPVLARNKQLQQIEKMLREDPIPPSPEEMQQWELASQQAEAQGQPPPPQPQPQPSVPIDERWDFHEDMLAKTQEWIASDACAEALRNGLQNGVNNIKLQGAARDAVLAKRAQQNAPAKPPMSVSAAFKDLDPSSKVQALQRDGYMPDQSYYDTNAGLEQEGAAADTAETNATAIHKSVLAARDRVKPHEIQIVKKDTPDNAGGGVN